SEVSVVIPTYNGKNKLAGALEALQKQTFRDFEIVISDDGSTDGTSKWVGENAPFAKLRTGPNLGRAGARNAGAKIASGNWLIFLDDDMHPEPDCLQKLVERAQTNEGIFTGAQRIPQLSHEDPKREECLAYRRYLERRWQKEIPAVFAHLNAQNIFFTAAVCLIPRKFFEHLGGFDERLRDAEDLDFALRALEAQINVFYEPAAVAWHHDFPTLHEYVLRQIEYRAATARLLGLHPEYVEKYARFGVDIRISPIKKLSYWLTAHPATLSLLFIPRALIPENLRFRMYDRVVSGLSLYFPDRMLKHANQ
ncbi:MAG: glycosyltransferase family 2 protein, partial [Bacteroidia bacterium]|nr:glycosyltransferase family 2 protein [Bacteroidia bacterium]